MKSGIPTEQNYDPSSFSKEDFVGSWQDLSPAKLDFTLYSDGTAKSDNMETLLYEFWTLDGDKITFTIKSIGNVTSSTNTVSYMVRSVSKEEMILNRNDYDYVYKRK